MDYATEKQLIAAVKAEQFSWLGWQFWTVFALFPKTDKVRKYHEKIWNSLTEEQKEMCEQI